MTQLIQGIYRQILRTQESKCAIGIGNTSSWAVEGIPPAVNLELLQQTELVGYVPATILPVIQVSSSTQGAIPVGDSYYIESEGSTQNYLVQATIYHDDLLVSNYRSLGLYTHCTYTSTARYLSLSNVTNAYVERLKYFPPLNVVAGFEHIIRWVIQSTPTVEEY